MVPHKLLLCLLLTASAASANPTTTTVSDLSSDLQQTPATQNPFPTDDDDGNGSDNHPRRPRLLLDLAAEDAADKPFPARELFRRRQRPKTFLQSKQNDTANSLLEKIKLSQLSTTPDDISNVTEILKNRLDLVKTSSSAKKLFKPFLPLPQGKSKVSSIYEEWRKRKANKTSVELKEQASKNGTQGEAVIDVLRVEEVSKEENEDDNAENEQENHISGEEYDSSEDKTLENSDQESSSEINEKTNSTEEATTGQPISSTTQSGSFLAQFSPSPFTRSQDAFLENLIPTLVTPPQHPTPGPWIAQSSTVPYHEPSVDSKLGPAHPSHSPLFLPLSPPSPTSQQALLELGQTSAGPSQNLPLFEPTPSYQGPILISSSPTSVNPTQDPPHSSTLSLYESQFSSPLPFNPDHQSSPSSPLQDSFSNQTSLLLPTQEPPSSSTPTQETFTFESFPKLNISTKADLEPREHVEKDPSKVEIVYPTEEVATTLVFDANNQSLTSAVLATTESVEEAAKLNANGTDLESDDEADSITESVTTPSATTSVPSSSPPVTPNISLEASTTKEIFSESSIEPEQTTEQPDLDNLDSDTKETPKFRGRTELLTNSSSNSSKWRNLDDDIIKSIEEVLQVDIPVDSKLLYRDSSPRFTRDREGQQLPNVGYDDPNAPTTPYSFSYTILDENTRLTHSREEEGDADGVVRGSYEVREDNPECNIRLVEYKADAEHGFDVLRIDRRPCQQSDSNQGGPNGGGPTTPQTLSDHSNSQHDSGNPVGKFNKAKQNQNNFGKDEPFNGIKLSDKAKLDRKKRPRKFGAKQEKSIAVTSPPQPPTPQANPVGPFVNPTNNHFDHGSGPFPIQEEAQFYQNQQQTLQPTTSYGASQENPSSHLDTIQPATGYGIPVGNQQFEQDQEALQPANGYGAPQENVPTSFGQSQEPVQPSTGYGVPQHTDSSRPNTGYRTPDHEASSGYGAAAGPITSYGIPVNNDYLLDEDNNAAAESSIDSFHHEAPNDQGSQASQPPNSYGVPIGQPEAQFNDVPQPLIPETTFDHQQPSTSYGGPPQDNTPSNHGPSPPLDQPSITYGSPPANILPNTEQQQAKSSLGFRQGVLQHGFAPLISPIPQSNFRPSQPAYDPPPPSAYGIAPNQPPPPPPPPPPTASYGPPQPPLLVQNNFNNLPPNHGGFLTSPVTIAPSQIDATSLLGGFGSPPPVYSPPPPPSVTSPRPPWPTKAGGPTTPTSIPNNDINPDSYDPFAFQHPDDDRSRPRKEARENAINIRPDDLAESSQKPVLSVQLPPNNNKARQPKNSFVVKRRKKPVSSTSISTSSTSGQQVRRNMLMNIVLRPGDGDKERALPRPKVDVRSEGWNVIVVRLTFPENENIQGLRAFAPKDDDDKGKEEESGETLEAEGSSPQSHRIMVKPVRVKKEAAAAAAKKNESFFLAPETEEESKNSSLPAAPPLEMFTKEEVVHNLPPHPPLELQPHLAPRLVSRPPFQPSQPLPPLPPTVPPDLLQAAPWLLQQGGAKMGAPPLRQRRINRSWGLPFRF